MERSRVLIVAQSPFQLALMADLLEANDIETVRVHNPAEATRALGKMPYSMVVVDLDLGRGSGSHEGVDAIKKESSKRGIPLLLVTDTAQKSVADQILAGCRAVTFVKPIDTSAFPRRVIQEIRRSTTQAQA
jgi:CheY-like chemotaxis protein